MKQHGPTYKNNEKKHKGNVNVGEVNEVIDMISVTLKSNNLEGIIIFSLRIFHAYPS